VMASTGSPSSSPRASVLLVFYYLVQHLVHSHPREERQAVHDWGLHGFRDVRRGHDQVVALGAAVELRHFGLVDLRFDAVGLDVLPHLVRYHCRSGDAGSAGDQNTFHRESLLTSRLTSSGVAAASRPDMRSGSWTMSITSASASR